MAFLISVPWQTLTVIWLMTFQNCHTRSSSVHVILVSYRPAIPVTLDAFGHLISNISQVRSQGGVGVRPPLFSLTNVFFRKYPEILTSKVSPDSRKMHLKYFDFQNFPGGAPPDPPILGFGPRLLVCCTMCATLLGNHYMCATLLGNHGSAPVSSNVMLCSE